MMEDLYRHQVKEAFHLHRCHGSGKARWESRGREAPWAEVEGGRSPRLPQGVCKSLSQLNPYSCFLGNFLLAETSEVWVTRTLNSGHSRWLLAGPCCCPRSGQGAGVARPGRGSIVRARRLEPPPSHLQRVGAEWRRVEMAAGGTDGVGHCRSLASWFQPTREGHPSAPGVSVICLCTVLRLGRRLRPGPRRRLWRRNASLSPVLAGAGLARGRAHRSGRHPPPPPPSPGPAPSVSVPAPPPPRSPSRGRSLECILRWLRGRGESNCTPFSFLLDIRWIHFRGPRDRPASSLPCRCFYLRGLQAIPALRTGQAPCGSPQLESCGSTLTSISTLSSMRGPGGGKSPPSTTTTTGKHCCPAEERP
nr:uncharacterized protein LOC116148966 [Camelus dromedarius]